MGKVDDSMVVVTFTLDDVKELGISKEKFIETLNNLGAPTEEIAGKIASELSPNRPDWFSKYGMFRAMQSYLGKETGLKEYKIKKGNYVVIVDKSVKNIRPCSLCAVVTDLKLTDEKVEDLLQLQEKLMLTLGRKTRKFGLGFFDLNKITFPVKYTTMEPEKIIYKPLNYPKVANAKEILEKHAKGWEHGHLIKHLEKYPLYIDSAGKVLVLIPIVNSEELGMINDNTNSLFVEVTGNDMNAVTQALNIVITTLIDMGGTAYSVQMHYPDKKFESLDMKDRKMKLDLDFLDKILGVKFNKSDVVRSLKRMGYGIDGDYIVIPRYRADVMHFVDIVEDIAIVYGYNSFEPSLPNFFTKGEVLENYDRIDEVMRNMGFIELKNFILTNKEKVAVVEPNANLEEISNPVTTEYTVLRPNLITSMLEAFALNKMRGLPQNLYEIGNVYVDKLERRFIFGVMGKDVDFSVVRGYLQTLFTELGMQLELRKQPNNLFDKEVSSIVFNKGRNHGVFGKVNKDVLRKFLLEDYDVFLGEFTF